MSTLRSKKGTLAIKPLPRFQKPEVKTGSFATIAQKHEVVAVDLAMDYEIDGILLKAGRDQVILPADSNLQQWANKKVTLGEVEFVICPEQAVIGFRLKLND